MPVYTYRREDGTTFDYRQKFADEPLRADPVTGQRVVRVVQAAGIVFKGSGFYVTDSRDSSRKTLNGTSKNGSESTTDTKSETKSETKTETKSEARETPKASVSTPAAD